ncbi:MAG: hypothetical protein ACI8RD_006988 [Bacillariaceae sp.]|jgi:hypothetical protein
MVNHWVLYAQIIGSSDNEVVSVQFDMGQSMNVGKTNKECLMGDMHCVTEFVKTFDGEVAEGATIGQIISLICDNHYDAYDFHTTGIGCRYWVKSTIELLSSNGLANESDTLEAIDGMKKAWNEGEDEPVLGRPITCGTFHFGK